MLPQHGELCIFLVCTIRTDDYRGNLLRESSRAVKHYCNATVLILVDDNDDDNGDDDDVAVC